MIAANVNSICELLRDGAVRVRLPGRSKQEVLRAMLGLLESHPSVTDFDEVCSAVFRREEMMSTGVGKGLALPHAKTGSVKGIVAAFATTAHPIEYEAIDGVPVNMLFLMISTERAKSQHIKLLSRVSRLMNEDAFRSRLLEAQQPEDVLQVFQEGELDLT